MASPRAATGRRPRAARASHLARRPHRDDALDDDPAHRRAPPVPIAAARVDAPVARAHDVVRMVPRAVVLARARTSTARTRVTTESRSAAGGARRSIIVNAG